MAGKFISFLMVCLMCFGYTSSLFSTAHKNSKFLDPQLTEEENLSNLAEAPVANISEEDFLERIPRTSENEEQRGTSSNTSPSTGFKKFGFLRPILNMVGLGNGGSYGAQYYNIPGTTGPSANGYRVPFFNYPYYNYNPRNN